MNRNTYYIEYLIVGSIAVALYLHGTGFTQKLPEDGANGFGLLWALMIVPLAYISGILVDAVGVLFFETPLRYVTNDSNLLRSKIGSRTVDIILRDENLFGHLRTLRSRDRIVRGSALALLATCLFDIAPSSRMGGPTIVRDLDIVGDWPRWLAMTLLFATWVFLHNQTRKFKSAAHEASQTA